MTGRTYLADIVGIILHQTDLAVRFLAENKEEPVWLPLSQIEVNDDGTITLPEWLAIEKGLI